MRSARCIGPPLFLATPHPYKARPNLVLPTMSLYSGFNDGPLLFRSPRIDLHLRLSVFDDSLAPQDSVKVASAPIRVLLSDHAPSLDSPLLTCLRSSSDFPDPLSLPAQTPPRFYSTTVVADFPITDRFPPPSIRPDTKTCLPPFACESGPPEVCRVWDTPLPFKPLKSQGTAVMLPPRPHPFRFISYPTYNPATGFESGRSSPITTPLLTGSVPPSSQKPFRLSSSPYPPRLTIAVPGS